MHTVAVRLVLALGAITLLLGACGPMHTPLPVRLQPEEQAKVDEAWSKAFDPVDRLDNQALLDALLISQAYQSGVDRLTFRSEKSCAAGLVVMESYFDRDRPDDDRFIVTLHHHNGSIARQEVYRRGQIASAYEALFIETMQLENREKDRSLTPQDSTRLAELRERAAVCEDIFPKSSDESAQQF